MISLLFTLSNENTSLTIADLWYGEDLEGHGQRKAQWNVFLLQEVVGRAYADMLEAVAKSVDHLNETHLQNYWNIWPNESKPVEPWRTLAKYVYKSIGDHKVFFSHCNDGTESEMEASHLSGSWVSLNEAVFLTSDITDRMKKSLLAHKIPLVTVPSFIMDGLREAELNPRCFSPALLRKVLQKNHTVLKGLYLQDRELAADLLEYQFISN